jgi:hypothetical protein
MASISSGGAEETRWSKPKPRYIKLNVDAAFHDDRKASVAGAIL